MASIQLILGSSGAGKSHRIYSDAILASISDASTNHIIIVPEQFTMQTQKDIVMLHPSKGILNIDVLSFERLAYRVFEETGLESLTVLDDTGKNLILRKVLEEVKDELKVFHNKVGMNGFVSEMKSIISELFQYGIDEEKLELMLENTKDKTLLKNKIEDIKLIYNRFKQYLQEKFIASEELLDVLCREIENSKTLQNSSIYIDGFTGFTPIQYRLLGKLMSKCIKVTVTITIRAEEADFSVCKEHELFRMSKVTATKLYALADDYEVKVCDNILLEGVPYRFKDNLDMHKLEKNLFRGAYDVTDIQGNIFMFDAQNPNKEVEYVANNIYKLVKEEEYRFRDIAVITGDMESYYRLIEKEFAKNNIKAFIDHKRNILNNPLVETIRSLVEINAKDFSYESIFRYLKAGMCNISSNDINTIENYVIAMGIRGFKQWNTEWNRECMTIRKDALLKINETRENIVISLSTLRSCFKDNNSDVKAYTKAIYDFIHEGNMQEKLKENEDEFDLEGKLSLAKEYSQAYKLVIELFDKLVALMGQEVVGIREYADILDSGFAEIKVGVIPPSIDRVIVGDIERTRLNDIKVLFFIGVNDGIVPKNNSAGGILSRADREVLYNCDFELSPTPKESAYMQRFYLYLNMTKPKDKLYLSFSNADNSGKSLRPSYLINTVRSMFSGINILSQSDMEGINALINKKTAVEYLADEMRQYKIKNIDDVGRELYSVLLSDIEYHDDVLNLIDGVFYTNVTNNLNSAIANVLYGENNVRSITRLEKYASCAYSHFLGYGLALVEREEHSIEAVDMGNLYHDSIELVATKIEQGDFSWNTLDDEQRGILVEESVNETVENYRNAALTSNARNLYKINNVKRVTNKTIWALSEHVKRGSFKPTFYEYKIPDGRVDRVDLFEDGDNLFVKVIDYKSGNKKFDLVDTYYGIQLQLVLYLDATIKSLQNIYPDKNVRPGAVFYYNIKDPYIERSKQSVLDEFKMSGLINISPEVIEALDNQVNEEAISSGKVKGSEVADIRCSKKQIMQTPKVISEEKFNVLNNFITDKMNDMNRDIYNGNIELNPYKKKQLSPCSYCSYKAICGFDSKNQDNSYRRIDMLKEKDIWEKIYVDNQSDESN